MSPQPGSRPSPSTNVPHHTLNRYPAGLRSPDAPNPAASALQGDEAPLGASLGGQLPRRNHTISSGTARASTRRLAEHFEQPPSPSSPAGKSGSREAPSSATPSGRIFRRHNPASPSRNSLQDILKLEDPAHEVEWEQAIQDERHSADEQLSALLSQVSGSTTASSSVRRHQSLNYHGARAGNRLHSTLDAAELSPRRPHHTIGPVSPPTLGTQLQNVFGPPESTRPASLQPHQGLAHSKSTNVSPVSPSAFSQAPWNAPGEESTGKPISGGSTSPSRFAHTFSATSNGTGGGGAIPSTDLASPHSHQHPAVDRNVFLSADLMDVHASLQKMDIQDGRRHPLTSSVDLPRFSNGDQLSALRKDSYASLKKLPALKTNPEALAQSRHVRTGSALGVTVGDMASQDVTVAPREARHPTNGGHSRVQSTDAALYGQRALYSASDSSPPPSLAGVFGPHTAAPISRWSGKADLVGTRPQAGADGQPLSPPFGAAPQAPHIYQATGRGDEPPSQWGLALSPTTDRSAHDQHMLRLSLALAEKRQEAAALEAMLRSGGQYPPTELSAQRPPPNTQGYGWHPPAGPPLPDTASPFASPDNRDVRQVRGTPRSTQDESLANAADVRGLSESLGLNPVTFELQPPPSARFLVIKSFTEDDVHRSIRHGIWASTDKGNQRLNRVYLQCQKEAEARNEEPIVYLFFSVNGSGHFCGLAAMTSAVDFDNSSDVWAQEGKWKGTFQVQHIFVKDVPNRELRHIKLPNNPENKSVTQSRDTQELHREAGIEMLKIIHSYPARTSLLQGILQQPESAHQASGAVPGAALGPAPLQHPLPPAGRETQPQYGVNGAQPRASYHSAPEQGLMRQVGGLDNRYQRPQPAPGQQNSPSSIAALDSRVPRRLPAMPMQFSFPPGPAVPAAHGQSLHGPSASSIQARAP
ncbi:unnamed protein product [Parajaminaea phylloscopi]